MCWRQGEKDCGRVGFKLKAGVKRWNKQVGGHLGGEAGRRGPWPIGCHQLCTSILRPIMQQIKKD